MILKRISGLAFALAIICVTMQLLHIGREYVSDSTLRMLMIIFGLIGILGNILDSKNSKHSITYTIVYWFSVLIILIGVVFKINHWPFSTIIMIIGLFSFGITFFIPSNKVPSKSNEELLDNF